MKLKRIRRWRTKLKVKTEINEESVTNSTFNDNFPEIKVNAKTVQRKITEESVANSTLDEIVSRIELNMEKEKIEINKKMVRRRRIAKHELRIRKTIKKFRKKARNVQKCFYF